MARPHLALPAGMTGTAMLPLASAALYAGDAVDGLVSGAVFALLAMGVVTIHRTTGTLNLAQGGMATLGALGWIALRVAGVATVPALLVVVLGGVLLGALIGAGIGWPLHRASPATKLAASLGLLLLVQGAVTLGFGEESRLAPPLLSSGRVDVLGVRMGVDGLVVLGVAVLCALALHLLFARTRLGLQMRAVAEDPDAAALLGVRVRRVVVAAWAVGVGLAAAGGVLLGPTVLVVGPLLLTAVALQALGATLIGRIASLRGALVGGLLLGELVTFVRVLLPDLQGSADLAIFVFIVAVVGLRRQAGWSGARA